MKTLTALAAATAMTLSMATGAFASEVKPLATTKSTQSGTAVGLGGLSVGATAALVAAAAILITVVIQDDDDSSTTTSTTASQ